MTARTNPSADTARGPMRIAVLGTTNKTSTLDLRERLAFLPHELGPALEAMKAHVPEGAILSTCHRVELYAAAPSLGRVRAALTRFWSEERGVPRKGLDAHLYYMEDEQAVAHLFSVASGMDSAIVGEPQILGQVRAALDQSLAHHATGSVLSGLMRQAVTVGRRIRTETGISRNAASISYAAVELAREICGDLRSSRVLLVGAGKMGELAAKNLASKGVAGLVVVGRSAERRAAAGARVRRRRRHDRAGGRAAYLRHRHQLHECAAPHHLQGSRRARHARPA